MRLELDFDNKVVTIYEDVNLRELFETLKKLNIDKDEWTLEPFAEKEVVKEVVKEYVYIPTYKPYVQPFNPWELPKIWCGAAGSYMTKLTVSTNNISSVIQQD